MHKIGLYAIKDDAVGTFGGLIEQHTDSEAVRSLKHHVNFDKTSIYAKSPQDFSLWKLGEVDRVTGMFVSNQDKICNVVSLLEEIIDV